MSGITLQGLATQLAELRSYIQQADQDIAQLAKCQSSLPRGLQPLERMLAQVGGVQYPLRMVLGPIQPLSTGSAGDTYSATMSIDQSTIYVCDKLIIAPRVGSGTYDGMYFVPHPPKLQPGGTGFQTIGYKSVMDQVGGLDADLSLSRAKYKEQDNPVPLSMFDERGVYRYPHPIVLPGGSVITAELTLRMAPSTDIDVYLIYDGVVCEQGQLPAGVR